jgi:hypothetical protein
MKAILKDFTQGKKAFIEKIRAEKQKRYKKKS